MGTDLSVAAAAWVLFGAISQAIGATLVSPVGDSVPANLLRIELRLEGVRSPPPDLSHLRLLREGRVIDNAFLGLPLPARDGRTLTILLHPGRIKTGVGPNLAVGPALRAGDRVTLEIDDPPLRRTWRVTAARRERLHIERWELQPPPPGSRAALRVVVDAELGSEADGLIAVANASGRRVSGSARLSAGGREWLFTPSRPWDSGRYELRVHPALEDVAGNRPCAAFEQPDLSAADCASETRRAFQVGRP